MAATASRPARRSAALSELDSSASDGTALTEPTAPSARAAESRNASSRPSGSARSSRSSSCGSPPRPSAEAGTQAVLDGSIRDQRLQHWYPLGPQRGRGFQPHLGILIARGLAHQGIDDA